MWGGGGGSGRESRDSGERGRRIPPARDTASAAPCPPPPSNPEVPAVPSGGLVSKKALDQRDGTPWSEPPGTRATPTLHNKGLPEGCA